MKVQDFIRLEVQHQGFDLGAADLRVEWMTEAWQYAQEMADIGLPELYHLLEIGRLIERQKNANGFRVVGVQVGGRVCAPSFLIVSLLAVLLKVPISPLELYKQFQLIHPFEDGNGRTGKILLCWLNGTLDDPEMPPDFSAEAYRDIANHGKG